VSSSSQPSLAHAAAGEFIATVFLLIAVVGSGIAAERLSGGNVGLALLANALATSGALFMLILTFGALSGAHMNPVVTLAACVLAGFPKSRVPVYIAMQVAGAIAGTWLAHLMFDLPILQASTHVRTGLGMWTGEIIATFGLLIAIWRCLAYGVPVVAGVVAAYIGGAYWFTSSTSFANPAVTIARALTDTFAGIRPGDAPGFIAAQIIALGLAIALLRWVRPREV
jgi:glycerol uptake facilitator-like aquaporin